MAFHQDLVRQGERLFRRRSFVPAILLVPVVLTSWWPGPGRPAIDHQLWWGPVCLIIGGIGLAARVIVAGSVAADTSGRNTVVGLRAARLNTTGPYSLVRNPLYAANYLLWIAPSLMPARWWVPVITTLGYWMFYERIILAEEAFLERTFGSEFLAWASKTPALWPFRSGWRRRWVPGELPFSVRTAARREYPGLLAFGVTMTGIRALIEVRATGELRLGWPWILLLGSVILASAVLRFLNHRSRALAVEGR